MSNELELILIKGLAYVSGVEDAMSVHFKNEPGPFEALIISRHPSLMDGNVIDQDISEGAIDLIPFYSPMAETS